MNADNTLVKANRIDATIVDKENKKVSVVEMSCPWVENREERDAEKTTKYGPLRWELEQRYPEYRVTQFNIIVDVLGEYSRDVRKALKELVGDKSDTIALQIQKSVITSSAEKLTYYCEALLAFEIMDIRSFIIFLSVSSVINRRFSI